MFTKLEKVHKVLFSHKTDCSINKQKLWARHLNYPQVGKFPSLYRKPNIHCLSRPSTEFVAFPFLVRFVCASTRRVSQCNWRLSHSARKLKMLLCRIPLWFSSHFLLIRITKQEVGETKESAFTVIVKISEKSERETCNILRWELFFFTQLTIQARLFTTWESIHRFLLKNLQNYFFS